MSCTRPQDQRHIINVCDGRWTVCGPAVRSTSLKGDDLKARDLFVYLQSARKQGELSPRYMRVFITQFLRTLRIFLQLISEFLLQGIFRELIITHCFVAFMLQLSLTHTRAYVLV